MAGFSRSAHRPGQHTHPQRLPASYNPFSSSEGLAQLRSPHPTEVLLETFLGLAVVDEQDSLPWSWGDPKRPEEAPTPQQSHNDNSKNSPSTKTPSFCPEATTFNAYTAVIPCCLTPRSKGLPQAPSWPGAATSPGGLATTKPSSVGSGGSAPITALRFVVSSHVVAPKSKAGRTAHSAGKKHKKKPGRCWCGQVGWSCVGPVGPLLKPCLIL